MKWFKHLSDSHTNGKMRQILRKHGLEGYAFSWICRELVAKDGEKYRLKPEKEWKITLKEVTDFSEEKIDDLLKYSGQINAICDKSLKKGELYIPKMREYSDNYSKYGKSYFKEASKSLSPEEKRREEKRREEKKNILEHFKKVCKEETGLPLPIRYGKDQRLINELLELYDEPTLITLIDEFFVSARNPAEWWADKLSIGVFKTVIPQLIGRLRKNGTKKV